MPWSQCHFPPRRSQAAPTCAVGRPPPRHGRARCRHWVAAADRLIRSRPRKRCPGGSRRRAGLRGRVKVRVGVGVRVRVRIRVRVSAHLVEVEGELGHSLRVRCLGWEGCALRVEEELEVEGDVAVASELRKVLDEQRVVVADVLRDVGDVCGEGEVLRDLPHPPSEGEGWG
eukprot:scaffold131032_cov40-Phaeocystis_antarctica.AAC.1